jgi:hypothetical protein
MRQSMALQAEDGVVVAEHSDALGASLDFLVEPFH